MVPQDTVTCAGDDLAWLPTSQMDMLLAVAQTCSYCSIICCGVAAVVGDYMRHSSSYVCHATSSGAVYLCVTGSTWGNA